ncbi:MAG: biopolymer transporter ExbD [Pirellulales bacterium]|nr:biopolymer transporter ExbD [Pirellulales bacterium]|tara:strand:- start:9497 stop:9910 length:414 start_codon:yes stop_codon:yes gene_type:complete
MRFNNAKQSRPMQLNMTSMIDIVFLLIIFFMIVSQISETNKEQIELPALSAELEQQSAKMTVNINADSEVIVSGESISTNQLQAMVTQELAEVDGNTNRLFVTLRVDRNALTDRANEVMEILNGAGIPGVRVAVAAP